MDCAQVVGAGEEGRREQLWEYSAKRRFCFVRRQAKKNSVKVQAESLKYTSPRQRLG